MQIPSDAIPALSVIATLVILGTVRVDRGPMRQFATLGTTLFYCGLFLAATCPPGAPAERFGIGLMVLGIVVLALMVAVEIVWRVRRVWLHKSKASR